MEQTKAVATVNATSTQPSIYSSEEAFNSAQRLAKQLASSTMVPKDYQNNVSNTLVALEMAYRTGASPLMVMQNLNVIQGKPSWSSSFIIAALNSCGRFSPLRFRYTDHGHKTVNYMEKTGFGQNRTYTEKTIDVRNYSCVAIAKDASGEEIEGPAVSVEMAVKEGWYTKSDSKWPTMTKLMLSYRAAAFFGRLYAPDVLQGMQTTDEVNDVQVIHQEPTVNAVDNLNRTITNSEFVEDATLMHEEIRD